MKTLVSKEDEEEDVKYATNDQKETNRLSDAITVSRQPSEFWNRFLNYCQRENLTSYMENSCIKVAVDFELTGKLPSDKQCAIIMRVYRRLEKDAILPPDLKIV